MEFAIESEKIRSLTSEDRREFVDYVTGKNISFEILGLKEVSNIIYGLSKENIRVKKKITLPTLMILFSRNLYLISIKTT